MPEDCALTRALDVDNGGAMATTRATARMAASDRHVVVLGGGIQGASSAFHLAKRGAKVTIVEVEAVGSAASGKAGGFLARDWGSGPTRKLHTESFRMHRELAGELGIESYRGISTVSVASGRGTAGLQHSSWLDGGIGMARLMDDDQSTAQVTPLELTEKLASAAFGMGAELVIGRAKGIVEGGPGVVEGVRVSVEGEERVLECTDVLVAMGVWSTLTAPWFNLDADAWPITGIKSTHAIWTDREAIRKEPVALFCGEEPNGTHLEIYPRANGDMYACGIGGSDYVDSRARLEEGGDCGTPSSVQADLTRVKAATASAAKLTSLVQGPPERVGACMRPCPPDAMPFMDRVEGWTNAFISAGHNW